MATKEKKTVAFLLDMLYEDYAIEAWKGAIDAAKDIGLRLLAFTGGNLKREDAENRMRNEIYRLVSPKCADAVICLSASLANTVGTESLLEFCRSFEPLPMAHIGIEARNISYFRVDGYTGTRKAVEHLIDIHGRKAIGYIRGPVGIIDADERYKGYVEALEGRGIPFDPKLVFVGDFYRESGQKAIRAFLDERGLSFDGIVSANDFMANFAMRELALRGIRVPQDVSVIGFDDISIARSSMPQLSTIRQPIREIATRAMESLSRVLHGETDPLSVGPECGVIPADFILRRSCGCQGLARKAPETLGGASVQETNNFHMTKYLAEFSVFMENGDYNEATALIARAEARRESFPSLFEEALIVFETQRIPCERASKLLSTLVQAVWERRLAIERLEKDEDDQIQRVAGNLMSAMGPDRFGKSLRKVVQRAGLNFFLAVEYLDNRRSARVIQSSVPGIEGTQFNPSLLVPPGTTGFEDQESLVVLPLYVRDESLGYFITDSVPDRRALLELLRDHLSSAVMAARAEEREQTRAIELEALVAKRTAALEEALNDIGSAKERIERISITDELTGILNRRGFFKAAERERAVAARRKSGLALAFVDIDGLKSVNDIFGHKEGDWLISSTARVLREGFRSTDILGRMGGDEFIVLAVDCTEEDLVKIRERLSLNTQALNSATKKPYELSFSMGTVLAIGTEIPHLDELIAKADELLYEEKRKKKAQKAE